MTGGDQLENDRSDSGIESLQPKAQILLIHNDPLLGIALRARGAVANGDNLAGAARQGKLALANAFGIPAPASG